MGAEGRLRETNIKVLHSLNISSVDEVKDMTPIAGSKYNTMCVTLKNWDLPYHLQRQTKASNIAALS